MRQFRLIITTLGLTVLVWIAADQSLTESAEVVVSIEPVAHEGSTLLVELQYPQPPQVKVRLIGPRKRISELERSAVQRARFPVDVVNVGLHAIDLRGQLQKAGELFSGLTIESTEPAQASILADRAMIQTVPVELDQGSLEFEESLRAEPPLVKITIREGHWKRIEAQSPGFRIPLDRLLRGKREGEMVEETVALESTLLGFPVQADPLRVTILGKLLRPLSTVAIPAVPIYFSASPELWNHFEIDLPQDVVLTQTITVKGPRERIERLQSGEQRLIGTIAVTGADTESGENYRAVEPVFRLPPEIELVNPPAVVEFRLRPRAAASSLNGLESN